MLGLLFAALLQAGQPRMPIVPAAGWTHVGPVGATVNALAVDPHEANTVYASTVAGLFRSTDSGESWTKLPIPNEVVESLAMAPSDPSVLYAATTIPRVGDEPTLELLRSTDAGATWTRINEAGWPFGYSVAVDPTDALTIYANAPPPTLSRSFDGGSSWTALPLAPTSNLIAIDPRAQQTLYANGYVGASSGVFKSSDAGSTWDLAGLRVGYLRFLNVDPVDSQTLYAGHLQFFVSHDGGGTWSASEAFPPSDLLSFAALPGSPSVLYVGTYLRGVYTSADEGETWSPLARLEGSTRSLAVAERLGIRILYAGTDNGVWRIVLPTTRALPAR